MGERAQIQRKKAHEPASSLQHRLTNPAPGQQLDSSARAALEPRLGHSFANVRVHADGEADQLAQQVEARAFTVGQDVYFRQGTYDPASPAGLHLLAHELTHTVQQARGPVSGVPGPNGVLVSDPADSFEQAAGQAADAAFTGAAPPALSAPGGGPGIVAQREEPNRDPRFQLTPPQLRLPVGPLDLQANTSAASLGYTSGGLTGQLGYQYGGDISAGVRDGDLSAKLGVNPGSGALSLGGSYDQFRLGASADPASGKYGFNLGYGAPLLPWTPDLSRTMQAGGEGLTGAVGALPGAPGDPLGYYSSQKDNIGAVGSAVSAGRDLAGRQNSSQGVGGNFSFQHNPATAVTPEEWKAMATVGVSF